MNTRAVWIGFLFVVAVFGCTTPAPAPTRAEPTSDDNRLVTRQEFQASLTGARPSAKVVSWTNENKRVTFVLADGKRPFFEFANASTVRFFYSPTVETDASTTVAHGLGGSDFSLAVVESESQISIASPALALVVEKADLGWKLQKGDATLFQTNGGPRQTSRRLALEFSPRVAASWIAAGLSGSGWIKNGQSIKFWNDRWGNDEETAPVSVPLVYGLGAVQPYALYLDNSYQSYLNLGESAGYWGTLDGNLDLYFITSKDLKSVLQTFSQLTGKPSWSPHWALGTSVRWDKGGSGSELRKNKLSIETAHFASVPDEKTVAELKKLRFRVTAQAQTSGIEKANLETGTIESSVAAAFLPASIDGFALPGSLDSGGWNDRYWDNGRLLTRARVHNVLGSIQARSWKKGWNDVRTSIRPWLTFENAFAGTSEYGTLRLKADANQNARALSRVLAAGLSGFPFVQIEVDLSTGASGLTEEHWRTLALWAYNPALELDLGPNPDDFWKSLDSTSQARFKKILQTRSQLKAYFYLLSRQASLTGLPVWRALALEFPSDVKTYAIDDEFLLGDSLLIAPSVVEGKQRNVYLPTGTVWFDWHTGEEFNGGQTIAFDASSDRPAIFARAGAMVTLGAPETFDSAGQANPVTIHVFPGSVGSTVLYQDDGTTNAYLQGDYNETRLTYSAYQRQMEIEQQAIHLYKKSRGQESYVLYRVHKVYRPKDVRIDNQPIPLFGDSWGVTDSDRSAAWYENDNTLLIKAFRPEQDQVITMNF